MFCFYVSKDHQKFIEKLIEAGTSESQRIFEKAMNKLLFLNNTLQIKIPHPPLQKRGSCSISNALKNTARTESFLSIVETEDFRGFLYPHIATEIPMDDKLIAPMNKLFKKEIYQQAWKIAFNFCELYEGEFGKINEINYGILIYQAFHNRFKKSRFDYAASISDKEKLKDEMPEIINFFNKCIANKYYKSAFLLLIQFSKSYVALRSQNDSLNFFRQAISKETSRIDLPETLFDLILTDIFSDINKTSKAALIQFDLLDKFTPSNKKNLLKELQHALDMGNLQPLQAKCSVTIDHEKFKYFSCGDRRSSEQKETEEEKKENNTVIDSSESKSIASSSLFLVDNQDLFTNAVNDQNIILAMDLLERGAPINQHDSQKQTAMHKAAKHGGRILDFICKMGGDIYVENAKGHLPIHDANCSGVKYLLNLVLRPHIQKNNCFFSSKSNELKLLQKLSILINQSMLLDDLKSSCYEFFLTKDSKLSNMEILYGNKRIRETLFVLLFDFMIDQKILAQDALLSDSLFGIK